jgi:hypothetical protein
MKEYTVKVSEDGSKSWYLNGKLHREDGPAIERSNGYKAWCLNGKHHREDGPAVELSNGYKEWYLNGKEYTEEEFLRKTSTVKELTVNEIEALRQALAQPEQDRDSKYAGVRMWIGDKNIEYLMSKTCIEHEAIEGMSMSMAANSCLQALKGSKHD